MWRTPDVKDGAPVVISLSCFIISQIVRHCCSILTQGACNTNHFFSYMVGYLMVQHFLHGYDQIQTFSKMQNLIVSYLGSI